MKSVDYLGMTEDATKAIISNRELQSYDFERAQDLVSIFLGEGNKKSAENLGLEMVESKNGYVLVTPEEKFSSEKIR